VLSAIGTGWGTDQHARCWRSEGMVCAISTRDVGDEKARDAR
jgi:hypothetical protein